MTDIVAGIKIADWTVVGVAGRRVTCMCRCSAIRIIALDSLLDGSAPPSCGCAPAISSAPSSDRTGRATVARGAIIAKSFEGP